MVSDATSCEDDVFLPTISNAKIYICFMLEDCTSLLLRHWSHWNQTQHDLISTTVRPHIDSSPARPGLWHHSWTEGKGPRLESSTLVGWVRSSQPNSESAWQQEKKKNSWISPQRDLVHIHVWYFPENSVLERTCLYCGVGQASAASHPNNVFFLFVFCYSCFRNSPSMD